MQNFLLEDKYNFFIKTITEWFLLNKRNLPFRKTKDPYKIWISEIMLQQTRMGAVVNNLENKYTNFIKRFPDIYTLANSKIEEVLQYWSGLGYYNRAIYLHKTANIILNKYNGIFPNNYNDLIQLPGIGDYTASAILSICFDLKYSVLDGNVKRILFRFFYKNFKNFNVKEIRQLSNILIQHPKVIPSIYNQAIMEYGSLICIYNYPKCNICKMNNFCDVFLFPEDKKNNIPPKKEKKKIPLELKIFIIINQKKEILIIKNKQLILKNHYFFPFVSSYKYDNYLNISDFNNNLFDLKNPDQNFFNDIGIIKHNIMNYNISARIFYFKQQEKYFTFYIDNKIEYQWISLNQINQYIYSSFGKKILKLLNQFTLL